MTEFVASSLSNIRLSDLPFPESVVELSFEDQLSELKAALLADYPAVADVINLESDPLHILLERLAAESVKIRAWANDEVRNNTLAHAFGASLDNFAAFWGVTRNVIDPGDPDAVPPTDPVLEADDDFRLRIQLASEGLSVAGPAGAYVFHAKSASADVKGAEAVRGGPGEAIVYVLSTVGNGTAVQALLDIVEAYLLPRIPLCTDLIVQSATIAEYNLAAQITLLPTYDQDQVLVACNAAANAYVTRQHQLGYDVTIAGLHHALFQTGVQNVVISAPEADIVCGQNEAAFCTGIVLTSGGYDV